MIPFCTNDRVTIYHGDSLEMLKELPENSVDAVVTDPPYGIRFMGKAWDGADILRMVETHRRKGTTARARGNRKSSQDHEGRAFAAGKYDRSLNANQQFQFWTEAWAIEALRVLKPGGHLVSFASCRTYHRMTCGLEDAGFQIRDQLAWVFGSGFPKSSNQSGEWEGWGTALKPAWEPIALARKPLIGTVPQNLAAHGVGAINIDGCRVGTREEVQTVGRKKAGINSTDFLSNGYEGGKELPSGRWPANLTHDGSAEVLEHFPAEAGAAAPVTTRNADKFRNTFGNFAGNPSVEGGTFHNDEGSAARFFYCAKASPADRDMGMEEFSVQPGTQWDPTSAKGKEHADKGWGEKRNTHETVKPTELMRWLVRLVTPKGGTVLDPFTGSGSTGRAALLEGMNFIGMEREARYLPILRARLIEAQGPLFAQSL